MYLKILSVKMLKGIKQAVKADGTFCRVLVTVSLPVSTLMTCSNP